MAKAEKEIKKAKYEDRILNELNLILRQEISDTRLQFASLTKVELTSDFSVATVYWDTFDPSKRGEIKSAFHAIEGRFRSSLAKSLQVRHTPEIKLTYDNQYESEQNIAEILSNEAKVGRSF
jgi:ribosome-binding factor A